jgi:TPR repeat protein
MERAANWYLQAVLRGNVTAMHNLAHMYEKGEGVERDGSTAVKLLQLAADEGDAGALGHMGMRYARGEGVPRDSAKAVDFLTRAAEKGDLEAQTNLGAMYLSGEGIAPDPVQAYRWLTIAVDTERKISPQRKQFVDPVLEKARRLRRQAAARLTPAQTAEAGRHAAEWIAAQAEDNQ